VAHGTEFFLVADGDDVVSLPPDLVLARSIEATSEGGDGDPFHLQLTASWNDDRREYEITRLLVEKNTEAVTTLGLRGIAVQDLFQSAVEVTAHLADGSNFSMQRPGQGAEDADGTARLLWAARVYALSRAYSVPPLKAVADSLRVSQSTATRLIARARAEGMLGDDG
jgi:hypothetical protein